MPVVNDSSVVRFDATRAVKLALEAPGTDPLHVVEYGPEASAPSVCTDVVTEQTEDPVVEASEGVVRS